MAENAEIQAAIENLLQACAKSEKPVMILLQESETSVRALSGSEKLARGDGFKLARLLLRSGDLDTFLKKVISDAKKNGHKSMFLKAMGISGAPG
ncbi:hypothetical protein ACYPKM_03500 [Pseudomonas aeruginosa]